MSGAEDRMSEELGKIEKPTADEFKKGRKLYFVPLIYCGKEAPSEYTKKYNVYWQQVKTQIGDLEAKLGKIDHIYHELIPMGGKEGSKAMKELNKQSYQVVKPSLEKGAQLEAIEESELLTEFIDWNKCLATGLQNQKVFVTVYQSFADAGKKRNEYCAAQIDKTLKSDEIGILLMREGHQIQFPSDIQVFYVSPPALDELKRWFRDREAEASED